MTKDLFYDYPVFDQKGEDEYAREIVLDILLSDEVIVDRDGRRYEYVGKYLSDDDFYQGLNMVSVIRNVETGALYGYFWWDDISKHGEAYVEPNGGEFELECDTSAEDFDWDNDYVSYYVWEPVEEYSIKAFRTVDR